MGFQSKAHCLTQTPCDIPRPFSAPGSEESLSDTGAPAGFPPTLTALCPTPYLCLHTAGVVCGCGNYLINQ